MRDFIFNEFGEIAYKNEHIHTYELTRNGAIIDKKYKIVNIDSESITVRDLDSLNQLTVPKHSFTRFNVFSGKRTTMVCEYGLSVLPKCAYLQGESIPDYPTFLSNCIRTKKGIAHGFPTSSESYQIWVGDFVAMRVWDEAARYAYNNLVEMDGEDFNLFIVSNVYYDEEGELTIQLNSISNKTGDPVKTISSRKFYHLKLLNLEEPDYDKLVKSIIKSSYLVHQFGNVKFPNVKVFS